LPFRVAKIRPAARRHTEGVAVALHLLGHVAERIERALAVQLADRDDRARRPTHARLTK